MLHTSGGSSQSQSLLTTGALLQRDLGIEIWLWAIVQCRCDTKITHCCQNHTETIILLFILADSGNALSAAVRLSWR